MEHLPNFLVVGAVKAGTTSLHAYLQQHPEIYMSPVKETNFFSDEDMDFDHFNIDYKQDVNHNLDKFLAGPMDRKIHIAHVRTWEHYRKLFKQVNQEKAIGEVSNSYLYCPSTALRIKEGLPNAKIVMVLRNPIDRLYSQFLMNLRLGKITEHNLMAEIESDQAKEHSGWGVSHLYLEVGMYFNQVKKYLNTFPDQQVQVILFDDFKKDAAGTMQNLFSFLEVDESFTLDTSQRLNEAGMPRFGKLNYWMTQLGIYGLVKKMFPDSLKLRLKAILFTKKDLPQISIEEKTWLSEYYRDDILSLGKLIGRDLSHWITELPDGADD